jgi:hypothetical protein
MSEEENSIQSARQRRKGSSKASAPGSRTDADRESPPQAAPQESAAKGKKRSNQAQVPEEVRKRFVRVGNDYHFPDGTRAFTDSGSRLSTRSENTEVIRSLVQIAQAREWNRITVQGTERFRREVWFSGKVAGLEVAGYQPTEFEQERLVRVLAGRRGEQQPKGTGDMTRPGEARAESTRRSKRDELIAGRLLDHGRAPYKDDGKQPMSYFIKLETKRGERVVWGVDLERALRQSLSRAQVGDEVGLRMVGREAVKVRSGETAVQVHRNRWILEKREFFEERAAAAGVVRDGAVDFREAVKARPELAGTCLQLHVAELVARKRLGHPEDQKRFVDTVRAALADSVQRGEPLPTIRLREKSAERASPERVPPEREPEYVR